MEQKRMKSILQLLVCILGSVVLGILTMLVRPRWYDISADWGCGMSLDNGTWVKAFLLMQMWPVLIGLLATYYCVRIMVTMIRAKLHLNQLFPYESPHSSAAFHRLTGFCIIFLLVMVPATIYNTVLFVTGSIEGQTSTWNFNAPYNGSYWDVNVTTDGTASHSAQLLFLDMERAISGIIWFAFFATCSEAKRLYRSVFRHDYSILWLKLKASRDTEKATWSPELFGDGR
ncbi:hypothetical protein BZG36_01587 [Bifiguratus adelaidae]|uniref:G-protein coupled receptors family 1 profile domain-containing protein n=1 Tax=Bifiguratus adelaidae TaxID=1938954 RepID=A0A261Y3W5_9FUNG|nr:hypothetical protein BZG36_01587 [Bifiguratus adelaidae]